ncbi:hypothetical protein HY745_13415 [Candidatus Desantisbacteria bacterium]|nr:hypothetical protein [Candidatus Desantisbacteria bacterium]
MPTNQSHNRLLSAIFAEAKSACIDSDLLRNSIAPAIIKKRMSAATNRDLFILLTHLKTKNNKPWKESLKPKFDSSRSGLIKELESVADARWGEGFEKSLNAFINSNNKDNILKHYKFLNISTLKAIKNRIKELNNK